SLSASTSPADVTAPSVARAPSAVKTAPLSSSSSPFTMPAAAPLPSSTTYSPSPAAG
ncbi:unnamed protein product, partial [Pylaiella littoralis]